MKKVILLIVLIAAAVWYFDTSRRMTEAAIRESYQTQVEALQRFDAEPLCDSLDNGYSASVTMRDAGAPAKTQDKATACAELTRALRRFKTLSERTAGVLEPDYDYEIQSITLSPDRKLATVEVTSTMRIGDMALARSRSVEHLIRHLGRIRNTGGESTVWAYQGE
jgi:hypothetical protein